MTMKPETRQTLIAVGGLSFVMAVAISEGFNGRVLMAYFVAVVAIVAPEALERLAFFK